MIKHEISLPAYLIKSLPEIVRSHRLKKYLPSSFSHGKILFCHEKQLAFYYFLNQEACSSLGRTSSSLHDRLIDQKNDGYVILPDADTLRAAEVYDGGEKYGSSYVRIDNASGRMHMTCDMISELGRAHTPPNELSRTNTLTKHLQEFIQEKGLPLTLEPVHKVSQHLCIFSGGGDLSVISSNGCVVIGGTVTDEDLVTPLKEGDVATTANLENNVATNPQCYEDCEQQLFANMHLSATNALIAQLIDGTITPKEIERVIAYGTILKPGTNYVALYKLVAPFNKETYIQLDFAVQCLYWHPFFDRVLVYAFNKLSQSQ